MPIVQVNQTAIYYEEHGTGRPLVFIHGLGLTHTMWTPQVETFSRTHRVITIDVRGAGHSGKLRGWRRLLQRQTADLMALLNQLGIEQVVLCGVSYGGVFAQRFVLEYPQRCAGLIVVDSFSSTRPRTIKELGLVIGVNLGAPFWLLPGRMLAPVIAHEYAPWPLAQQYLLQGLFAMRRYETMKLRYAINWIHYTPELKLARCPTLGIVGDHEPLLVEYMRTFTQAIAGAHLEIIPHSFDPTNLCQRECFDQLVGAFLQQIGWTDMHVSKD
ncbi:alpha/beta hydrolase [Ktedonosporobacter rubrisoli]|uniref:Alpha/beta hydrolase n=1 Tax=Ktedonosporobacter rubrisoli TaxID=2509675 RepID=A0A4P6K514_KTERU|nr:alpha/beta hydrolase [Ktedonosporobacter rubrisoli]QBD83314.1 alpha/beta hydrolase [Ktedonosporobacter rubrisoli]